MAVKSYTMKSTTINDYLYPLFSSMDVMRYCPHTTQSWLSYSKHLRAYTTFAGLTRVGFCVVSINGYDFDTNLM